MNTNTIRGRSAGSSCATTDGAAAKKFYSDLFGWTPNEMPMDRIDAYIMLKKDGNGRRRDVSRTRRSRRTGCRTSASTSADDAAAKAKELGGKVDRRSRSTSWTSAAWP